MTPKLAMREILQKVESVSGYPVHVQEDENLAVIATVRAASESVPFTLVRHRKAIGPIREYAVAFQCGFVLRQYELPPKERWDVAASGKARKELIGLVRRDFGNKIGQHALEAFSEHLLGGVITQLRSAPIGLHIDEWIADEFPMLEDQQRTSAESQLEENMAVLAPRMRDMVPKQIYNASVTMNAATAAFWARKWDDSRFVVPYKAAGFADKAVPLLEVLDKVSSEAAGDKELIGEWASRLGIDGWQEFVAK